MPFIYIGATITARELTIGETEDASDLARIANGGKEVLMRHLWFAQYQLGAVIEGVEPFRRVTVTDGETVVREAYQAWRKLPNSFADAWTTELSKTETAVKNG